MLWVAVPLMVIGELPALNAPLLTKSPFKVKAKLEVAFVLRVAPWLMVRLVLTTVAVSRSFVPEPAMLSVS